MKNIIDYIRMKTSDTEKDFDIQNSKHINNTKLLRPCDCTDNHLAMQLNEQAIAINENSLKVEHGKAVLTIGHTTINIPLKHFKIFATWFLEEQEINK